MEENRELPDPIGEAVKKLFGLSYLFPYQRLVVSNILEAAAAAGIALQWPGEAAPASPDDADGPDQDRESCSPLDQDRESLGRQIVILPTGAGKSLCFQLPAMIFSGPTLVIYPILSLMADQERRLREKGFAPVILRGGQSKEEREGIWEKLKSGESRFIIANPEVLLSDAVKAKLGELGIVHVVIDEAHCVSEWGESFRPDYLRLPEIITAIGGKAGPALVTAFTATASDPVLEKIEKYIFGSGGAHRIIGNPDRANISYAARGCILRDLAVRDLLLQNSRPAIVFCSSRPGTEKLARYLRNELDDKEIFFYHAGLSREEKTIVEKWFFDSARGVLIATCAYGMGVDKADIRTVIHRDCPPSVEAYLQESGRAGRDGKPSRAFFLWGPGDEQSLGRAKTEADRLRLEDLLHYGRNTQQCRREQLLSLLNYEGAGDKPEGDCCDVCQGRALETLREEIPLRDFFKRNRLTYTLSEAVPPLTEQGLWSAEEAREAMRYLVKNKRLRVIKNFLWKSKLVAEHQ
ncbi:ATP-dependent DNA helicase RecQ [Spirochaetia bacterium]|nr:ATP-dependent DNA helicase RecQ [Spirochaetia bacterium]